MNIYSSLYPLRKWFIRFVNEEKEEAHQLVVLKPVSVLLPLSKAGASTKLSQSRAFYHALSVSAGSVLEAWIHPYTSDDQWEDKLIPFSRSREMRENRVEMARWDREITVKESF